MRVLLICSLLALMMMMMVCEGAEDQMDAALVAEPHWYPVRVRRQARRDEPPPACSVNDEKTNKECMKYCKARGMKGMCEVVIAVICRCMPK